MYFITWSQLIGFGYYMFFCHDVSNALFNHVTPNYSQKAGSFSQKQVLTCLVKTGNDSAIFQGHDSRMISIDQLKTSP